MDIVRLRDEKEELSKAIARQYHELNKYQTKNRHLMGQLDYFQKENQKLAEEVEHLTDYQAEYKDEKEELSKVVARQYQEIQRLKEENKTIRNDHEKLNDHQRLYQQLEALFDQSVQNLKSEYQKSIHSEDIIKGMSSIQREIRLRDSWDKIEPFWGDNAENLKRWINEMGKVLLQLDNDDSIARVLVLRTLKGPAAEFITREIKMKEDISWEEIKSKLTLRYVDMADLAYARQKLRRLVQTKSESVQNYFERVMTAAKNAYGETQMYDPHVQSQLTEIFLDGMNDDSFVHHLIRLKPKTLDDALEAATREQESHRLCEFKGRNQNQAIESSTKKVRSVLNHEWDGPGQNREKPEKRRTQNHFWEPVLPGSYRKSRMKRTNSRARRKQWLHRQNDGLDLNWECNEQPHDGSRISSGWRTQYHTLASVPPGYHQTLETPLATKRKRRKSSEARRRRKQWLQCQFSNQPNQIPHDGSRISSGWRTQYHTLGSVPPGYHHYQETPLATKRKRRKSSGARRRRKQWLENQRENFGRQHAELEPQWENRRVLLECLEKGEKLDQIPHPPNPCSLGGDTGVDSTDTSDLGYETLSDCESDIEPDSIGMPEIGEMSTIRPECCRCHLPLPLKMVDSGMLAADVFLKMAQPFPEYFELCPECEQEMRPQPDYRIDPEIETLSDSGSLSVCVGDSLSEYQSGIWEAEREPDDPLSTNESFDYSWNDDLGWVIN